MIGTILSVGSTIGNLLQGRANRKAQERQNQLDREHQNQVYAKMRADAIADRNYENQYNSPQQQMERLRQAGLNPNLIYGKGAEHVAASTNQVSQQTPNQPAPQFTADFDALRVGIQQSIMQHYDIKAKQAQTDNTEAATTLLMKEALVKDASLQQILTNTARSKFDLEQAQELKDQVIMNAKLSNENLRTQIDQGILNQDKTKVEIQKIRADIDYTIAENARKEIMNGVSVKAALQHMALEQAQIEKAKAETAVTVIEKKIAEQRYDHAMSTSIILQSESIIKEAEAALAKQGIFKTDKAFTREMLKWIQTQPDHSQGGAVKNPDGTYDRTKGWQMPGQR